MKIPLDWLQQYIKLEHTPKQFGDILTSLEFMQDGPIEEVNGQKVIDLEVRQNRPDMLSIIGVAREYAAYINKKVNYPEQIEELKWEEPGKFINIVSKDPVKRFNAIQISEVKIKKSPDWIAGNLQSYGISPINNIVDITNYVMLEYGIPLHAFDIDKLAKEGPLLSLEQAKNGERFTTWQGVEINLTKEDLVFRDAKGNPIGIGGITGGVDTGITNSTTNILLEAADYNHAAIRRTAMQHSLFTESGMRHSKILPVEFVERALARATYLIQELAGGDIGRLEEYYPQKGEPQTLEFNVFEVNRIGGVQLETETIIDLLTRLGFEVIERQEAIAVDKNVLLVKAPEWRTDINYEADLIEEVLRLWGYENIHVKPLDAAPPNESTPDEVKLENKIRTILAGLGLDEHITNPLVKYNENDKLQIKLENPLTYDKNALRTSIRETLKAVVKNYRKAGRSRVAVFEVGKAYTQKKVGEYKEERQIAALYENHDYADKIKKDFLTVIKKLGLLNENLTWEITKDKLVYKYLGKNIAEVFSDGFVLASVHLADSVLINDIPVIKIETSLMQKIIEEISFIIDKKTKLGEIPDIIMPLAKNLLDIEISKVYENIQKLGENKKSVTYKLTFLDRANKLTRNRINEIREEIIEKVQKAIGAEVKS